MDDSSETTSTMSLLSSQTLRHDLAYTKAYDMRHASRH
jgi:hypothetical protein